MFCRILVPLDGSEISEGILPYGTQLAQRLHAGVVLHTTVDPDSIYAPTENTPHQEARTESSVADSPPDLGDRSNVGSPHRSQAEADIFRDLESGLMGVAGGTVKQGVETDVAATLGRTAEQILATADAEECDLIALATHGRNAFGRGLFGSVTDRVVHLSTLPVLTISPARAEKHPIGEDQMRNVIVPLDGSELGESALPAVEGLADAMSLQVHLVRAFDPVAYDRRHGYSLALAIMPSYSQKVRAYHEDYLESVASGLASMGLDVKTEALMGPTAPSIVEYARESPLDINTMATHGRSGFRRLLLGSVTEAVGRYSSDPVLIIPPTLQPREVIAELPFVHSSGGTPVRSLRSGSPYRSSEPIPSTPIAARM